MHTTDADPDRLTPPEKVRSIERTSQCGCPNSPFLIHSANITSCNGLPFVYDRPSCHLQSYQPPSSHIELALNSAIEAGVSEDTQEEGHDGNSQEEIAEQRDQEQESTISIHEVRDPLRWNNLLINNVAATQRAQATIGPK